jgi:folate-binding protein YgfZ
VICLFRVARIEQGYSLTLPTELTDDVVQRLTMFRFRANVDFSILPATIEELGIEGSFDEWRLAMQPQSEHFTPHMLNLDLLGAVSVDKGCYPGQEIVARTHFRGVTKRRCLRFESTEPVSPGDKVSDGQGDVGEILNAIGTDLLAVVPVEKADKPLFVGETKLLHFALPYQ